MIAGSSVGDLSFVFSIPGCVPYPKHGQHSEANRKQAYKA